MSYEIKSYRPKTVFITGATSDFGTAFAHRFADIGCSLILHGRSREKLDALSRQLSGISKHILLADFTKAEEIERGISEIPENFWDIDLLINNAGGALGFGKIHEIDLPDANAMIDANCRSLLQVTRLVLPHMAKRKMGHIINITSSAANWPYPGGNVYCACKAFSKQLSLAMRCDLQGTNVRVSSIEPGIVETSFSLKRFKGDKEKANKIYANTTPLTAEDIAEAVFWTATLPPHVNINTMEVFPTKQSWSSFIEREE